MKINLILSLSALAILSGCETLQTPQQRQQAAARKQLVARQQEEQMHRVKGQVESVEMENSRLMQEIQQLRRDVQSYNTQIAQLNGKMSALEAKQSREMNELIKRVEGLLKKTVASRPAPKASHGAGHEHVVEAGHTLSAIAAAYGTTVSAIKKENNLKSDNIYVGQKLFIPE